MKRFSQWKKVGYPSAMLWALDLLYIVLQDLNPVTRHRCKHLITELVHQRDTTRTLIWQCSYNTNSFTWLYQTHLIVWLSRLPARLSQISLHHQIVLCRLLSPMPILMSGGNAMANIRDYNDHHVCKSFSSNVSKFVMGHKNVINYNNFNGDINYINFYINFTPSK